MSIAPPATSPQRPPTPPAVGSGNVDVPDADRVAGGGSAAGGPGRDRSFLTRHKARWGEWAVERGIFAVSLSAILMILLIFVFVGREALPVILGETSNARLARTYSVQEALALPRAELAAYLGVTGKELAGYAPDVIQTLVELKGEEHAENTNPDSRLNTSSIGLMFKAHHWQGYDRPEHIWQPVSEVPKFNLWPLILGSLKATLVALLFSVPLGVGSAIYVSQLASPRWREIIKPTIELLSGIPSVVLGFFGLIVMASVLQSAFGYDSRLNAFVAGIALGLAVVPVIFTISEDALTSVPSSYVHGSLALGATPWETAWKVVLPAAMPGVFAACVLGFGRAIGETMIVLMASGNATIMSASIFDSCRTMTATIAAELAEVVFGGVHYRVLFFIGTLLFAVTFVTNLIGDAVAHRLKARLAGAG